MGVLGGNGCQEWVMVVHVIFTWVFVFFGLEMGEKWV